MLKETTFSEKFSKMPHWIPTLIESVKKDLKNEHLKNDPTFIKKYFAGKNFNKLTTEELVEGYSQALKEEERSEQIAEFISNRWLMQHSDIYYFFETQLSQINPEFQEIEEIEQDKANHIMQEGVRQFGAPNTYLFSMMNSVAFPEAVLSKLSKAAEAQAHQDKHDAENASKKEKEQMTQRVFEEQIARLTDKFEKKILGLQKKYHTDMEAMKKQMAALQRKLNTK